MKRIAKHTICVKPGKYIAPGDEVSLNKDLETKLDAAGILEPKGAPKAADENDAAANGDGDDAGANADGDDAGANADGDDAGAAALRIKTRGKIEKFNAAGQIFEVVEIEDDGAGTVTQRVVHRVSGEPLESYADLPYEPRGEKETQI